MSMPPPSGSPFDRPQDRPPGRPGLPGPYEPGREYDDPSGPQDAGGVQRGRRLRGLPFPSYTTRTRGGTQVTVGGCCLPIPIGCLGALTLAAVTAREVRRRR